MRTIDTLLNELKWICGCCEISDLRYEPYRTRAISALESDRCLILRFTQEQLLEAEEYIGI